MKKARLIPRIIAGVLTAALLAAPAAQAAEAPTEQELAAARLQAQGIMAGDGNGELRLDDTLTRAELACLLSPISLNPEHVAWEQGYYTRMCTVNFDDVPAWAQVHVGVCLSMGLMGGYGNGRFGSSDPVTQQSFSVTWSVTAGFTPQPVKKPRSLGWPRRRSWRETPSPEAEWLSCSATH